VLCQDEMFQLPVCPSELHVEAHGDGAEDSHTAQSDNRKSANLQGRVYVGLEVEVVLVILYHPEPKIGDDKRLEYDQDLDRTGNVSLCSLDTLARKLSPGSRSPRPRIQFI